MFENVDGQTMDIRVTGILLAFGSGELIKAAVCGSSMIMYMLVSSAKRRIDDRMLFTISLM